MTNSTEPNCLVGSVETHLAGSVGDPAHAGKAPLCMKHMHKHTDTHICTYDTHVDRVKDGKIASVKQKPCDLFPTEFYPSASKAGSVSFDGIQKEQQEISFIKRNKTGKNILTATRSPTDAWQSERRTCAEVFFFFLRL